MLAVTNSLLGGANVLHDADSRDFHGLIEDGSEVSIAYVPELLDPSSNWETVTRLESMTTNSRQLP